MRLYVQAAVEEGEKKLSATNELRVELLHTFRVFVDGEGIVRCDALDVLNGLTDAVNEDEANYYEQLRRRLW